MSKIIRDIPFEMQGEYKREASFSREEIDQIIDYLIQKHDINIDDIQKVVEFTDFDQSLVVHLSKKYNIDEPRKVHLDTVYSLDGISIDFKMSENIVKATAKELGLTYRELGEAIGYSEGTLNRVASTGEVSDAMTKAIELYLANLNLQEQLKEFEGFKNMMKSIIKQ